MISAENERAHVFAFVCEAKRETKDKLLMSLLFLSAVSCKVDVSKMEGLSLHVEKLKSSSDCQMKVNSVQKDNIAVTSISDLSFQDCHAGDMRVTAMRVIGKSRSE